MEKTEGTKITSLIEAYIQGKLRIYDRIGRISHFLGVYGKEGYLLTPEETRQALEKGKPVTPVIGGAIYKEQAEPY